MKALLFLLALISAGLFGMAAYLSFGGFGAKRSVSRRLRRYAAATMDRSDEIARYGRMLKRALQLVASRIRPLAKSGSLEKKLQRAGLPLFASEFLAIVLSAAVFAFFLAWSAAGSSGWALCSVAVTALSGFFYLERRIVSRQKAFHRQLGDALMMMANALRSGFSFLQAVELVSQDMKPPVSEEFGRMMQELRLGLSMEEALQHLSDRVKSADLDLIIASVLIQRQVGGNLAQIFDTISVTINERLRMRAEINTITAQGRLTGWVLGLMPLGMGAISYAINPDSIKPLFETEIGRIAVAAALISEVIGILLIRKIVNIDI